MTATETVLETYELLENILANLRPQDVPVAGRVCKTWHALVCRSRRIKMARSIRPKYFHGKSIQHLHGPAMYGPFYEYSQRFTVNKLVVRRWVAEDPTKWIVIPRRQVSSATSSGVRLGAQYVSDPPITSMLVYEGNLYRHSPAAILRHGGVKCTVRNEQGITIADLVEVADALRASERRYAGKEVFGQDNRQDALAYGCFRVGSEDDEDGHQELTRMWYG